MPSLSDHQSNEFVKLLLLGDAKSGKTGSLVSLVKANYLLRILDFDNLLDFLKFRILNECADKIDNVEFVTLRDKIKSSITGPIIDGKPKAWIEGVKLLDRWKYDDVDLGVPAEWGSDCILVVDSLSRLADSAYYYHEAVMPKAKSGGEYDGRAAYYNAQKALISLLAMLTGKSFKTNLIVICHGQYIKLDDGSTKIFPQSVGKAIGPEIPQFFPNFVRYKNEGKDRSIQLVSDNMISLAVGRPDILNKSIPAENGLATIFQALAPRKVTSLKLERRA
jgi:hypothetical protein